MTGDFSLAPGLSMHRQDPAWIPLACDDKMLPLCQQKATLLIRNTLRVITKDAFFPGRSAPRHWGWVWRRADNEVTDMTLSQFRMQIFRIRIKTLVEAAFKISAKEILETVVFILFIAALGGRHLLSPTEYQQLNRAWSLHFKESFGILQLDVL